MNIMKTTAAVMAMGLFTLPAYAQNVNANANNLVTVSLQDIIDDITVEINDNSVAIPVTVQLPITLAANVCDVAVNVLAQQIKDGAECDAKSTSDALIDAVLTQG